MGVETQLSLLMGVNHSSQQTLLKVFFTVFKICKAGSGSWAALRKSDWKTVGSGSANNECRSTALKKSAFFIWWWVNHEIESVVCLFQWHPGCFVCKECGSPFHDGAFFEHEGHPYCETHYHALRGSLCAGCHKVQVSCYITQGPPLLWDTLPRAQRLTLCWLP